MEKVCCKEHPRATIYDDDDTGEMVCTECGVVIQARLIFANAEGHTYSKENFNPNQNRLYKTLNKEFTSTDTIAPHITAKSSPSQKYKFCKDKAMINMGKTIVERCSVALNCSNVVVDRAMFLFEKTLKPISITPKSVNYFAVAALYVSCKEYSEPRTLQEIARAGDELCIEMVHKALTDMVRCRVINNSNINVLSDIIPQFCLQLGLSNKVADVAIHLTEKALNIPACASRSLISMAAAAIYMVSQTTTNGKSCKEVSKVTGAAENKIKLLYQILKLHENQIMPDDYVD